MLSKKGVIALLFGMCCFAFHPLPLFGEPRLRCEKKWGQMQWEGMVFKRYCLRAEGFPDKKKYTLIVKSSDGTETQTFTYLANRKGHLILQPTEEMEGEMYAICPVKKGEKLTFIMRAEDEEHTVTAQLLLCPLTYQSKSGVHFDLELAGERGEKFYLTVTGLQPGEEVSLSYHTDITHAVVGIHPQVNQRGSFHASIELPAEGGGQGHMTLKRSQEEIIIPFEWGNAALKWAGACCLSIK